MTPAEARPLLAAALEVAGGTHTVEDVLEAIGAGRMQGWEEGGSLAVTEVVDYPRLRAVRIFAAAGDLVELERLHDRIEAWALSVGATRLEAGGRRGWERCARDRGWARLGFYWRNL